MRGTHQMHHVVFILLWVRASAERKKARKRRRKRQSRETKRERGRISVEASRVQTQCSAFVLL